MNSCKLLTDKDAIDYAKWVIRTFHYTKNVPSGKSYYTVFDDAVIIVWSIPANKNIGKFLLGKPCRVWELSRMWAGDNHMANILTQAISCSVKIIKALESPDVLVSYADPNAGHGGGVYKAASWIYHGQSEESRVYVDSEGNTTARRAFHSGKKSLRKSEILALGYTELKLPGKHRFVKPISRDAKRSLSQNRSTAK